MYIYIHTHEHTLILTNKREREREGGKLDSNNFHNLTGVEHEGHTYPAGAVCRGKLLICEIKQFVCIISGKGKPKFK